MLRKPLFCIIFLISTRAWTQVAPSSRGGGASLWVGGEVSDFNPDYGSMNRVYGPGVFVDFNLTQKLALQGSARWLRFHGDGGETEGNYLAGAAYRVYQYNKLSFYAQALLGGIRIRYPQDIGEGSYFAYAPAGLIDYRLNRKLFLRGQYQYQFIPSAPGFVGQPDHGLTPNGFSLGLAYQVLHGR